MTRLMMWLRGKFCFQTIRTSLIKCIISREQIFLTTFKVINKNWGLMIRCFKKNLTRSK